MLSRSPRPKQIFFPDGFPYTVEHCRAVHLCPLLYSSYNLGLDCRMPSWGWKNLWAPVPHITRPFLQLQLQVPVVGLPLTGHGRGMALGHAGHFLCCLRIFFVLVKPAHLDNVGENSREHLQPVLYKSKTLWLQQHRY